MLVFMVFSVQGDPSTATASLFVRTAVAVQQAEPDVRGDFARAALELLAQAYAEEARLARDAAETSAEAEKLLSWARAVERYSRQLPMLMDDVDLGFPVRLDVGGDGVLAVTVAERRVMLNHPRVDRQAVFETAILEAFCLAHRCAALLPAAGDAEPIPVSAGRLRPRWTFSEDGGTCSDGGIAVVFGPGADLAGARSLCQQFLHEARVLSQELDWQRRHAVRIEWSALALRSLPGRTAHALRLNAAGDTLLAPLPLIHGSPGMLAVLTPWLRGEVGEAEPAALTLRAADYGWEHSR
ncbi:MAG: hypothetical protein KDI09_20820 [Halioglobus sp.]|nr:hypothetical protein [Halioglobus sp.]